MEALIFRIQNYCTKPKEDSGCWSSKFVAFVEQKEIWERMQRGREGTAKLWKTGQWH